MAGFTVGLTVIPQALAYAGIAGLDPAVSRKRISVPIFENFGRTSKHSFITIPLTRSILHLFAVRFIRFIHWMFRVHFPWIV